MVSKARWLGRGCYEPMDTGYLNGKPLEAGERIAPPDLSRHTVRCLQSEERQPWDKHKP